MGKNIAITETYLSSVFKIDTTSRKLTLNTIKQLSDNPKSTSLQIHSIDRIKCDPKFRSARVNDDLRVIFIVQGDVYTLLYVDHHDDAYNWCEGKFLKKTDFGAEYIYDERVMLGNTHTSSDIDYMSINYDTPLLATHGIKEKQLVKLGVPQIHAAHLLKITSDDSFMEYITIFPSEIGEALLDLASGAKSFDAVYNELIDNEFDETIPEKSIHKDNKRRFYIVENIDELQVLMENDNFERWTIFLHPSQEKLVKRDFNGPVLVEGGPGTGKTIVGIHRAIYLSQHVYKASENKKILFCAFSKKLAKCIKAKLDMLALQKGVNHDIHVISIDSLIYTTIKDAVGYVKPVNAYTFQELLDELYNKLMPKGTKSFYEYEYHEVIEKYNIRSLEEYLEADRTGTGMPLTAQKRTIVWQFIEKLIWAKDDNKVYTFNDRALDLYNGLISGQIAPQYDAIIIDEAQDLEPIKLKALCKCVKKGNNNIMILSDMNQRVFRLTTWKNDIDINVIGRTFYLSINYRTTKQINDYARHQFIESEMIKPHIKEYKSIVHGDEPIVEGFDTEMAQYKFVVNKVNLLINAGRLPYQICIVCSTKEECKQLQSVFTYEDIKSTLLFDDITPSPDGGVCICPIHGVKGLEFEIVIIYNYNNIGKQRFSNDSSQAIVISQTKIIECVKYVAATRARDELIVTYLKDGE